MTSPHSPPLAELHLPDLPEVEVQVGGRAADDPAAPRRPPASLGWRLREAVSSYLPMLLMALVAVGTWWLVKHTPTAPGPAGETAVRQTPDYTMGGFSITRFAPDGSITVRLDGDRLRHYPATRELQIDAVRVHARGLDGRVTDATARQARTLADGDEVELRGGAEVISRAPGQVPVQLRSERLQALIPSERVVSDRPVEVLRGQSRIRASGMEYDHAKGVLTLQGPVRMVLPPGGP